MTAPAFVEVSYLLPVRTKNPLNMPQGNSKQAAVIRTRKRAKERETSVVRARAAMAMARLSPADLVPAVILLRRVSTSRMDDDGLAASCKGIRDGIADALGVNDGGPAVRWVYRQKKGKRGEYGVEVIIRRRKT